MEEGRAVCPGDKLTYTCTIFDVSSSFPIATWSGFCADNTSLNVVHGVPVQETDMCGPFSVLATASNTTCHTSTLTVTAPDMDGMVIRCRHNGVEVGTATILLVADGELEPQGTELFVT